MVLEEALGKGGGSVIGGGGGNGGGINPGAGGDHGISFGGGGGAAGGVIANGFGGSIGGGGIGGRIRRALGGGISVGIVESCQRCWRKYWYWSRRQWEKYTVFESSKGLFFGTGINYCSCDPPFFHTSVAGLARELLCHFGFDPWLPIGPLIIFCTNGFGCFPSIGKQARVNVVYQEGCWCWRRSSDPQSADIQALVAGREDQRWDEAKLHYGLRVISLDPPSSLGCVCSIDCIQMTVGDSRPSFLHLPCYSRDLEEFSGAGSLAKGLG
ncbi:hypothetical protein CRG98_028787 [Punica granatum]|uniref:Uncharacterized protein n=2 Tax=Punica granatum TaxID=22663 RepID=A0A2I0J3K4_PUNGR|nr:hypothetical protein CRG98_028787 [Punica granatum]